MMVHLLFDICHYYFFLFLSIVSKLLWIIFLYEFFFLGLIYNVLERSEEDYYRGDWLDDVVEDFLNSFEDDTLSELIMFLRWLHWIQ